MAPQAPELESESWSLRSGGSGEQRGDGYIASELSGGDHKFVAARARKLRRRRLLPRFG